MKIYLFTIKNPESGLQVCQVYAHGYWDAFYSLLLITGCEVEDLDYHDKESTTRPLNWIN